MSDGGATATLGQGEIPALPERRGDEFFVHSRQCLVDRRIARGCAEMAALCERFLPANPCTPGFGEFLLHLALWTHLGFDGIERLRDAFDRIDPTTEDAIRSADLVYLNAARSVYSYMRGDYEGVVQRVEDEVLKKSLANRDRFLMVVATYYLGRARRRMGEDRAARNTLQRASEIASDAGWPALVAVMRGPIAWLTFQLEGSAGPAERILRDATPDGDLSDDAIGTSYQQITLARIDRRRRRYTESIELLEPACHMLRRADNRLALAKALTDLAFVKRLEAARLNALVDQRTTRGHKRSLVFAAIADPKRYFAENGIDDDPGLFVQATSPPVARFLNQFRAALEGSAQLTWRPQRERAAALRREAYAHLREAKEIFLALTHSRGLGTVDMRLALLELDEGNLAEAEELCRKASASAGTDDPFLLTRVQIVECEARLARFAEGGPESPTHLAAAIEVGGRAIAGARALNNDRLILRALTRCGLALVAAGTAECYATARAYSDTAGGLLKGASDYAADDLRLLNRRLDQAEASGGRINAILREMTIGVRSHAHGGATAKSPSYGAYKKRLEIGVIELLLDAAGGPEISRAVKFRILVKIFKIPASVQQRLRRVLGIRRDAI